MREFDNGRDRQVLEGQQGCSGSDKGLREVYVSVVCENCTPAQIVEHMAVPCLWHSRIQHDVWSSGHESADDRNQGVAIVTEHKRDRIARLTCPDEPRGHVPSLLEQDSVGQRTLTAAYCHVVGNRRGHPFQTCDDRLRRVLRFPWDASDLNHPHTPSPSQSPAPYRLQPSRTYSRTDNHASGGLSNGKPCAEH